MSLLAIAATLVLAAPPESSAQFEEWLARPKLTSPRFLDHGTIELAIAAGAPHLYRLELRTGLFDVASLGVTGHWLPGQPWPQVWPVAALALWRGRMIEFGAHYRPALFPAIDRQLTFEPRAHFALASFTIGTDIFAAGLDVGVAHQRVAEADPSLTTVFTRQTVFGGGFVVRVGNEWIGASADALAAVSEQPLLMFEVKLDLRFDLAMVAHRHGTPEQIQARSHQVHR
jgi:hypothetical protein